MLLEPLLVKLPEAKRAEQKKVIRRAYELAAEAHAEQRRKSGEPYIIHPYSVAKIVADLGLDYVSIAAALLHDAVEDTTLEVADIEHGFGPEVAAIVDGVTKLEKLHFTSKEDQQSASFRKMLVAMAKDLRVLIVKLSDRLHNMRTLAALPAHKQIRIAKETLEIYAPLAHRLGMQYVKQQLEDLCFAAIHPNRFAEIEDMVAQKAPEREFYLTQVLEIITQRLEELDITAEVKGREKHLYSIYSKMQTKEKEFNEIHDLVGIRIIVDNVRDCYSSLGSVHSTWKPVQGRFKDYIAMPKFNLYQSLHTTVVGPQGRPVEFQVRTHEMHQRAESGAAAHFLYKQKGSTQESVDLPWLERIIDWEKETSDPEEFMENLKVDLEQEEVFVFTPKGKVVTLPANSTPIDFAYAIHTDVGHRCVGAKVNGKLVPLSQALQSGETVEIFSSKVSSAGPSRDWLNVVSSHRASSKIKQWFSRERREDAISSGEMQVKRALKREGKSLADLVSSEDRKLLKRRNKNLKTAGTQSGQVLQGFLAQEVADELDYADADALYAAIGENHISAQSVVARILKKENADSAGQKYEAPTQAAKKFSVRQDAKSTSGVRVEGLDEVMVKLSRCCNPVPVDEIMGFVTRGRGVSIHRTDCANAESLVEAQADRLIDVEWDIESESEGYIASLAIKAYDRTHLLLDLTNKFSELHINILASSSATSPDRIARFTYEFEIADLTHLDSVMRSLREVQGVYDVQRSVPGG